MFSLKWAFIANSEIIVLSATVEHTDVFFFAFNGFYLLFTETAREHCKVIYAVKPSTS